MLRLEVTTPTSTSDRVVQILESDNGVTNLSRLVGVSLKPPGDVVRADIAREAANPVIETLIKLDPELILHVTAVPSWVSKRGLEAEKRVPGAGADSVVWLEVVQRAYDDSELNFTYLAFMVLATLIAAVGVILDSPILVIGAMVLGPEFGPIAGLGVSLVRRRWGLLRRALLTLVVGFAVAIVFALAVSLVGRGLGWIDPGTITGRRADTDFIYQPDKWSLVVAIIAAAAGVLSITSAKGSGMAGVFISVTTIPAAGNIAVATAVGAWREVGGSALQLAINITGMALAGWLTLLLQQVLWRKVTRHRLRYLGQSTSDRTPRPEAEM